MRSRQRKTITLEVNDRQKAVLERNIVALPRESGTEPERTGSDLPSLFYHPNASARVLALVVSAGFDVARGRHENAEKKVNRAVEVFTLVTDDETGRGHLQGLAERLGNDTDGVLPYVHETIVPFLQERLAQSASAPTPKKATEAVMPRALEEGESLPTERRKNPKKVEPPPTKPAAQAAPEPSPAEEPAAKVSEETPSEPKPAKARKSTPTGSGPSAAEAAAAAAAALAAIEAPYEEVVEDDSAPRFDPDRDLEPSDGRKRRRRSKSPEGLERMKPDQRPDLEMMSQEDESAAAGAKKSAPADDESVETSIEELCRFARHGDASDLADLALDVARHFLRRTRDLEVDGRVKLEVVLTTADGEAPPQRRRRRRRRRGGRSDG